MLDFFLTHPLHDGQIKEQDRKEEKEKEMKKVIISLKQKNRTIPLTWMLLDSRSLEKWIAASRTNLVILRNGKR